MECQIEENTFSHVLCHCILYFRLLFRFGYSYLLDWVSHMAWILGYIPVKDMCRLHDQLFWVEFSTCHFYDVLGWAFVSIYPLCRGWRFFSFLYIFCTPVEGKILTTFRCSILRIANFDDVILTLLCMNSYSLNKMVG